MLLLSITPLNTSDVFSTWGQKPKLGYLLLRNLAEEVMTLTLPLVFQCINALTRRPGEFYVFDDVSAIKSAPAGKGKKEGKGSGKSISTDADVPKASAFLPILTPHLNFVIA